MWSTTLPAQIGSVGKFQSNGINSAAAGLQFTAVAIGIQCESGAIWLACLAAITIIALFAWLQTLKRKRAIEDTPTSKIVSASQGYAELQGIGRPFPDNPIRSPVHGLPCLWFRYQLEEKDSEGKWRIIQRQESDTSFILDDGTGQCLIDPEGAEIICLRREQTVRQEQRETEWKFIERDTLYALGDFKTMGGHHLELDPRADLKALLSEWKNDPTGLRQRFDLDGDGQISEHEWELVRAAGKREVSKLHHEARQQADSHVLRKPTDGRAYLISGIDPDKLRRRYVLWGAFHLVTFFGALSAIPWVWWKFV